MCLGMRFHGVRHTYRHVYGHVYGHVCRQDDTSPLTTNTNGEFILKGLFFIVDLS